MTFISMRDRLNVIHTFRSYHIGWEAVARGSNEGKCPHKGSNDASHMLRERWLAGFRAHRKKYPLQLSKAVHPKCARVRPSQRRKKKLRSRYAQSQLDAIEAAELTAEKPDHGAYGGTVDGGDAKPPRDAAIGQDHYGVTNDG